MMHNRDMIWTTTDGRKLKIKDIPSNHLCNILHFVIKHKDKFDMKYGKKKMREYKYNITQEIRLRKLNRLSITNENNLF